MKHRTKWLFYCLIVLLFLLHNDFWFWKTPQLAFRAANWAALSYRVLPRGNPANGCFRQRWGQSW